MKNIMDEQSRIYKQVFNVYEDGTIEKIRRLKKCRLQEEVIIYGSNDINKCRNRI